MHIQAPVRAAPLVLLALLAARPAIGAPRVVETLRRVFARGAPTATATIHGLPHDFGLARHHHGGSQPVLVERPSTGKLARRFLARSPAGRDALHQVITDRLARARPTAYTQMVSETRVTVLALEGGDKAAFRPGKAGLAEVAAYELSRRLGLGLVPPAIPYTLDGQPGALQLWIDGKEGAALHPRKVTEHSVLPEGSDKVPRAQGVDAAALHYLLGVTDRHDHNWKLAEGARGAGSVIVFDHAGALNGWGAKRDVYKLDAISRRLHARLKAISDEELRQVAATMHGPGPQRATAEAELIDRRSILLRHVQNRINASWSTPALVD